MSDAMPQRKSVITAEDSIATIALPKEDKDVKPMNVSATKDPDESIFAVPKIIPKLRKTKSAIKPETKNANTVKTEPSRKNNLLLAFVPASGCIIGIMLDYQKPQSFETAEKQIEWEEMARKEAEDIKIKLIIGLKKIDEVRHRVVISLKKVKISTVDVQIFEQESAVIIEKELIKLSQQLQQSLGLKKVDIHKCLAILKQYKELQLTKPMLQRNPKPVLIMRRVRNYIGNLKYWNLTSIEEEEFKKIAKFIRSEASIIYNNFKNILEITSATQIETKSDEGGQQPEV